ncbi:hypothetical protein GKZ68_20985 (plasmid) [Hymenobacter sp. BRD128]|uniref:hypothetical protein n=1 Tax=Hymenobacter sp. BRD128 TaxID=2675878 RepID=UPI001564BD13|nr:hypothetical protein [Hymenobacter sp. BRD128]QKG59158.1 hypothetical protein GKZ68_20985 [Hymenobacter sp. BRD128]
MKPSNSPTRPAERPLLKPRVYVYDALGKLLADYETVTLCAEKLALGRPCVNAGLQRGSIVAGRYYISYDKDFKTANFNQTHNPLQGRTHHPRGMRPQAGFLELEFFEALY